jgi:hypothetical protein
MKKSQLRRIIRESIKQLMTEQINNTPAANYSQTVGVQSLQFAICADEASSAPTPYNNPFWWTVAGQVGCCQSYGVTVNGLQHGTGGSSDITTKYGGIFWPLVQAIQSGSPINGWYSIGGGCQSACAGTPECPSPSTSAGSCNPSAWSNHANWTSTFTNTVNNANNTCNFLNIKIAQFTSQIPNVGPVWANQLQCKLDLANQLHASNNC